MNFAGEGSGNWGHEGRPGQVGGSGPGGGGGKNPDHTAFDNLHNEGGEGYNPYAEYEKDGYENTTMGERRDSINRKLNAIDYNDPRNKERIDSLRNQFDQTYISEGWTKDVTISRRSAWNTAIKSGKYTTGGKITSDSKQRLEKDMGFSFESLKEGVRIYGLK